MHVLKHGHIHSNYTCLCTFHALQIPNHPFVCRNKLFDLIKKILLAILCIVQTELGLLVQSVTTKTTCLLSFLKLFSLFCYTVVMWRYVTMFGNLVVDYR